MWDIHSLLKSDFIMCPLYNNNNNKNYSKFCEWILKPSVPIIHNNTAQCLSVSHLNICFNSEEATFTQLSFILSETQHTLLYYLGPGSKF